MNPSVTVLSWHFLNPGGKLRDGRPAPADGEWLKQDGAIQLCVNGLHASERIIDALTYRPERPECSICRVELGGTIVGREDDNKLASSERRILWRLDGATTDAVLRDFARWCALQVLRLWDAPDVVRRHLETGDESLRDAARDAAWAATRAASWDGARDAARDATWAAAWAASGDAAGAAARDAAGAAAGVSARAAAWAADGAAAGAAARVAQNTELERRFNEAHERSVAA